MAAVGCPNFDSDFFNKYATLDYYLNRGASGIMYGPIQCRAVQLAIKQVMFKDGKVTDTFKKDLEVKKYIWTSLEHEHLTRIHWVDLTRLPKAMFIVMEFAAGGSLYETIRSLGSENNLPIDVVTDWAKQIAEGMLYLHQKHIVHRDLKSSNILLMKPFNSCYSHTLMTLKIADFDDIKEHDHTTTMSFVGTCAYMAPEVILSQWFSKASDVWSFGVVIWEMLSGDIPYNGLDPNAILCKSATGELDKLTLEQSFPEDYKLIIDRCWKSTCMERLSFRDIFCVLQRMAQRKDVIEILKEYEVDRVASEEELQESLRESRVIRSNHRFLVENIKASRLIDFLHKKNCITDEERDRLNRHASSFHRNESLLHWMRTIPLKEDKGQIVLECFRQTKQNFVADILIKGGVLIKFKITTKLVKVSLFTISSKKNAEELKEKEVMVIKGLNQMQGLPLSSSQNAISEMPADDIVIAPYCHQEADGIIVWFWFQSDDGQRTFQSVYESGILLEKLITIFKEFSKDSVSSASRLLVPTSITIYMGDVIRNLSEFPEKYQSNPDLIKTIRTKSADVESNSIEGMTILDKELFVVSEESSDIEVYDSNKLSFSRRWNLKELIDPMDIASCSRNKCLYIVDDKNVLGQSNEILRVDANGKLIKKWSTRDDYGQGGLSVTDESNVILTVYNKSKLNEYSPDGQLFREINLSPEADLLWPWHAIRLTNGHFMVSHGTNDDQHRACIVNADGKLVRSFGGKRGSTIGKMNHPVYFAVDGNGFVMVADQFNHRVLLLDSDLKFNREILWKEKHDLRYPKRILIDDSNGRMLVADNKRGFSGRILIFQFCL